MVPWLLVQGLLGLLLAGLALYYLIIFPDKADCMPYSGIDHQEKAVNNRYHPYKVMKILKKRAGAKFNANDKEFLNLFPSARVLKKKWT